VDVLQVSSSKELKVFLRKIGAMTGRGFILKGIESL